MHSGGRSGTRPTRRCASTGSSPILTGAATNGLNDWQPIGVGDADHLDGASPNQRRFKADAGSKMILSGYSTGETIEDDTGDGDESVQMRDRSFRVPGGRSGLVHRP